MLCHHIRLRYGSRCLILLFHHCTYNQCPQGNLARIDTRLVSGSVYSRGAKAPSYMMRHVHANQVKCHDKVAKTDREEQEHSPATYAMIEALHFVNRLTMTRRK